MGGKNNNKELKEIDCLKAKVGKKKKRGQAWRGGAIGGGARIFKGSSWACCEFNLCSHPVEACGPGIQPASRGSGQKTMRGAVQEGKKKPI